MGGRFGALTGLGFRALGALGSFSLPQCSASGFWGLDFRALGSKVCGFYRAPGFHGVYAAGSCGRLAALFPSTLKLKP